MVLAVEAELAAFVAEVAALFFATTEASFYTSLAFANPAAVLLLSVANAAFCEARSAEAAASVALVPAASTLVSMAVDCVAVIPVPLKKLLFDIR